MGKKFVYLLLVLATCSCSVSFESIKSVSKLGKSLTDYKSLNDNYIFLCQQLQNSPTLRGLPCDSLTKRYKALNIGIDVLAAYSDVLLLATADNEFKLSDIVEQTVKAGSSVNWISANSNEVAGSKAIAGAVQTLVGNGLKRKAVINHVTILDSRIDSVCTDMLINIEAQKTTYNDYVMGVKTRLKSEDAVLSLLAPLIGSKEQVLRSESLNPDLVLMANRFAFDEIRKLVLIEKNIKAFQQTHHILVQKSPLIGTRNDHKVMDEIINALKDLFDGIEKFNTPVKPD